MVLYITTAVRTSNPTKKTVFNIPILKIGIVFDRTRYPDLSSECVRCTAAILPDLTADASGGAGSL
jgi:hypothetical protein